MKTYKIVLILIVVLGFSLQLQSQWIVQHSGLPASPNPTLIFSAVNPDVVWGIQFEIANPKCVLTTDGGVDWTLKDIQGVSGLQAKSIAGINESTAYIALDDPSAVNSGGIFITTNGGTNWVKQSSAFQGAGGHASKVYFFDANNGLCTGQIRDGYWEIYTTMDGGTNWARVPSANIPAPASGDITSDGAGAGNSFWFNSGSCSVYNTTDRGLTWSVTRNVFPAPAYGLQVAFKDNMTGLVSSYFGNEVNKLSSSTDGGLNWSSRISVPSHPSFYFLTYVPGTTGGYFITSHSNIGYPEPTVPGSAYTPDGGETWIQVDNLAHGASSFTTGNIGWSAGRGDTIYKWPSVPLGTDPHNLSDMTVTLHQNYPNPFSSSTWIQYQIPNTSPVVLKVYDILGSEVATLVNEEKSAGSYNVEFTPRGLSSGIYYYRLQVGSSVQTKKLLIL